ncbi:uncharacterized protein [Eurosta solidaginis]|uniref:uncharacterized protein n=1 Tax=Eurosta solidaginis TaxID=178769 RepID=UPI003530C723
MNAEDNIDYQLTQNFIFFLDILKQPDEVFDCRSREYKLARAWLDKLSMGVFETTDELRLRNIYMSHLVACLNYGKLTGPFVSLPKPGTDLDSVDFQGKVKTQARRVCPRAPPSGLTQSEKVCLATVAKTPCECDFVCCDKDEQQRHDQRNDCGAGGSPYDRICGYVTQYVNVPACLDVDLRSTMQVQKAQYHTRDMRGGESQHSAPQSPQSNAGSSGGKKYEKKSVSAYNGSSSGGRRGAASCGILSHDCGASSFGVGSGKSDFGDNCSRTLKVEDDADCAQNYVHIQVLLDAIASELRGEQTPGSNDFLECELARYKNFIQNYSDMSVKLEKLRQQPTLRSFLLLNLQNDLVKLLNENLKPAANMKREFKFD